MIDVQIDGGFLKVLVTERDAFLLTRSRDPWRMIFPLQRISRVATGRTRGFADKHHVLDKRGGLLICTRR
jgi:hypothetical protein